MVENSNANKEDGFVAIVLIIIVVVALAWFGISALTKKQDSTNTNSAATISSVVTKLLNDKTTAGACLYNDNREEYVTIGSALGSATTNFVNIAEKIDFKVCDLFQYTLNIPIIDSKGNKELKPVLAFLVDSKNKSKFDAYDWNNLVFKEIGEQLKSDDILSSIKTNIDGVKLEDIKFAGIKKEMQ